MGPDIQGVRMVEERPVEGQEGDIVNSVNRYILAAPFCRDKRVLDYGCGYGYGTSTLYNYNIDIIGVEPYVDVIQKAKAKFPNCNFKILTDDFSFAGYNIITCMEVIEHLEMEDLDKLLRHMSIAVPEFIGSTPNGDAFKYKPKTKAERVGFHVQHFTYQELYSLFKRYYNEVVIFGMNFDPNPNVAFYTTHMIWAHQ